MSIFVLTIVTGTASGATAMQSDSEEIGYVHSLTGHWRVDGETVFAGRTILRRDRLVLDVNSGRTRTPRLSAVLLTGDRIEFTCEPPEACGEPLALADSIREPRRVDRLARIVQAVGRLLREGGTRRYRSLISRGGPPVQEMVLRSEDGALGLVPLFEARQAGRYRLEFERVRVPDADQPGNTTPQPEELGSLTVEWDPAGRTVSVIREPPSLSVAPGLYNAAFSESPGSAFRSNSFWILVVDSAAHSEVTRRFEVASEIANGWDLGRGSDEARQFLRAYLEVLANEALER